MNMVAALHRPTKRAACFAPLPWHQHHPDKLAIEARLPDGHLARFADQAVARLDMHALFADYGGTGSLPHPPDRLLALVFFQLLRGRQSPAQWLQDSRENEPARWLLRGLQPCRSCWYNFYNRIAPFLDDLMHQVLQLAVALGITPAERASLDGTAIAAAASRRKLVNESTLQQRVTFLDQAVLADQNPSANTQAASAILPPGHGTARANGAPAAAESSPARAVCTTIVAAALLLSLATGVEGETTPAAESPPLSPVAAPADTPSLAQPARSAVADPASALPATIRPSPSAPPAADEAGNADQTTPGAEQAKEAAPRPGWMAPTARGRQQQQQRLKKAQARMAQRQARNSDKRSSKRSKREKVVVSLSDPEAALGLDKDKIFRPLYNVQLVRDLDSPLLLGYEVFAQPNDAGLLGPMLQKTKELSGRPLKEVLVDSAYAGGSDLSAAAAEGVTVYASLPRESEKTGKKLSKSAFRYVAEEDVYVCPEGQRLEYRDTSKEKRSSVELVVLRRYRCAAEHCQACPRQSQCTTSKKQGRTLRRSEYEGLVEELRQRMQSVEAKALYRWRGQTVELANADIKEHRKLRRFSARGLKRARCQIGLMVLAHNLLVVLQHEDAAAKDDHPETDRNQCSGAA